MADNADGEAVECTQNHECRAHIAVSSALPLPRRTCKVSSALPRRRRARKAAVERILRVDRTTVPAGGITGGEFGVRDQLTAHDAGTGSKGR